MTMVLRTKPLSDVVRGIIKRDNGVWLDASDLSTMYQDAAGTIPVTAMEQSVGKWLDKSGNGNHATQSITARRPVISARKNLLLSTDTLSTQSVYTVAAQQTLSFTGPGSVTLSGTATGTLTGTGANNRVSLTFIPTAGTLTLTVSGDVRLAQLEYGPTTTTYQRVNTATDYDASVASKYLKFDGIDDYLNLPYMGLYANGSASVVMAKSADYQTNTPVFISESSTSESASSYLLLAGVAAPYSLGARIRTDANIVTVDTRVLLASDKQSEAHISSITDNGSAIKRFENSGIVDTDTYTRSGTVAVNRTVIGAFYAMSAVYSPASMNIYGLILTKSALSDTDRRKCEVYLGRKAGVQL